MTLDIHVVGTLYSGVMGKVMWYGDIIFYICSLVPRLVPLCIPALKDEVESRTS